MSLLRVIVLKYILSDIGIAIPAFFSFLFFFFAFSGAAPAAYGGSQARG